MNTNNKIKKRPCLGQHGASCLKFVTGTPERRLCIRCAEYIERLEYSDNLDHKQDEYEWEYLWRQG